MSTYIFGVFPLLFWTSCERYTMKKSSENSVRDFVRFLDCLLLPVELEGFAHAYNAYNRVQSRTNRIDRVPRTDVTYNKYGLHLSNGPTSYKSLRTL